VIGGGALADRLSELGVEAHGSPPVRSPSTDGRAVGAAWSHQDRLLPRPPCGREPPRSGPRRSSSGRRTSASVPRPPREGSRRGRGRPDR
jgi:hypothetical protein